MGEEGLGKWKVLDGNFIIRVHFQDTAKKEGF